MKSFKSLKGTNFFKNVIPERSLTLTGQSVIWLNQLPFSYTPDKLSQGGHMRPSKYENISPSPLKMEFALMKKILNTSLIHFIHVVHHFFGLHFQNFDSAFQDLNNARPPTPCSMHNLWVFPWPTHVCKHLLSLLTLLFNLTLMRVEFSVRLSDQLYKIFPIMRN